MESNLNKDFCLNCIEKDPKSFMMENDVQEKLEPETEQTNNEIVHKPKDCKNYVPNTLSIVQQINNKKETIFSKLSLIMVDRT